MILLQAHRGDERHFPENTFPSYYGAIKAGYDFIELDPHFTKDDECVLIHDASINRTGRTNDGQKTDADTPVSSLTVEELKMLDFGVYFAPEFKGTRIPTLDELLNFVGEERIPIKFDNVIQNATDKQLDKFLEKIKNSGVESLLGITAYSTDFVKHVTDRLKECTIHYDGPVGKEILDSLAVAAKENPLYIWLPNEVKAWLPYPPATAEDVELARKYGKVGLWTAHDDATLEGILAFKPDAMEIAGSIFPEDVRKIERAL